MTIQQTLLRAIRALRPISTSANLDAEVLLSYAMNKSKAWLLAHQSETPTTRQAASFRALLTKRKRGVPIAYLTGHKEFYGLDFEVNPSVLVPRPETELLVEETIAIARAIHKQIDRKKLRIADIGTGSGCIAITLAKFIPDAQIYASDVSAAALRVAEKNAKTHKVSSRITFLRGDLFSPYTAVIKKGLLDVIVSNPPYLKKKELPAVKHEPEVALYGGKMGIEVLDRLLARATHYLAPHGAILLEIGADQAGAVDYAAQQQFPEKSVRTMKDLAGRDRVVVVG